MSNQEKVPYRLIKDIQSDYVRLSGKVKELEEDVAFAKKVIWQLLGDKTLVYRDIPTPTDLDFDLSENEAGEMLIRLKGKKLKICLNENIDLEFEVEERRTQDESFL